MRIINKKFFLRSLLILASLFFAAFIPEIFATKGHILWAIPYILADFFLVMVAVLYRFPSADRNKMRDDVKVPPATTSIPTRDFQKDLQERDELFQMMVDISSNGFWTFDVVTGKVYWSQRALNMLQVDIANADDSFDVLRRQIVESDWDHFRELLNSSLESGDRLNCVVTLVKSGSKNEQLTVSGNVQKNADGRPVRVIGSVNMYSDKQAIDKQSFYYAYQDALTGVYNRKFFLEKLTVSVQSMLPTRST